EDEIAELLKLDVDDCDPTAFVPTKALFSQVGLMIGHTSNKQHQRMAAIMSRLGYEVGRKRINGALVRGYFRRTQAVV
ncbi:hypothetical protein, partial [Enterobacter sp. CPE_E863]